MDLFTQIVMILGRITPTHIEMLGTAFMISNDGVIGTPRHVIGDNPNGIVVLMPHIGKINEYQDVSNNQCDPIEARVIEIDPIKDLALLKVNINFSGKLPSIGSLDEISVGETLEIFGFPHCTEGRRVLTFQRTEIGAKILLESNGIKSKHAVLNIQSRPGQSGSAVFSSRVGKIVGVLIGTYAPQTGIIIGNINPAELNQTTQIVSAEYLREMM